MWRISLHRQRAMSRTTACKSYAGGLHHAACACRRILACCSGNQPCCCGCNLHSGSCGGAAAAAARSRTGSCAYHAAASVHRYGSHPPFKAEMVMRELSSPCKRIAVQIQLPAGCFGCCREPRRLHREEPEVRYWALHFCRFCGRPGAAAARDAVAAGACGRTVQQPARRWRRGVQWCVSASTLASHADFELVSRSLLYTWHWRCTWAQAILIHPFETAYKMRSTFHIRENLTERL